MRHRRLPSRGLVPLASLAVFGLLSGCTPESKYDKGTCGNGVIEDGEDCDSPLAGCGQHGDGDRACRFTCTVPDAGTASTCATDRGAASAHEGELRGDCKRATDRCGFDGVCRRPSGAFESPILLGRVGDLLQIVDYDGDAYPDLALRGVNTLAIYRNTPGFPDAACRADPVCSADPGQRFQLAASGTTRRADSATVAGIALVAHPSGFTSDSFIAAIENGGLAFYSYKQGDTSLTPLLVPSVRLQQKGDPIAQPVLVGSVSFAAGEQPMPLLADDADARHLAVYDLQRGGWSASIDLITECGFPAWQPMQVNGTSDYAPLRVEVGPGPGGGSLIAMVWRGGMGSPAGICAAFAKRAQGGEARFQVVRLPVPSDPMNPQVTLGVPVIGEFDASGTIDIAVGVGGNNGLAPDRMVLFPGRGEGTFGSSVAYNSLLGFARWTTIMNGGGPPITEPAIRAADVDGDQRADLVVTQSWDGRTSMPGRPDPFPAVLRNSGLLDPNVAWTAWKMPFASEVLMADAADVTGDGKVDWIGIHPGTGQVTTCIGNGVGVFACGDTNTPLSKISNGEAGAGRGSNAPPLLADMNGDLVNDIVIGEPGGASRSLACGTNQGPGQLAVLLGGLQRIPSELHIATAFRAGLRGFAPTHVPTPGQVGRRNTTDLIVALETQAATSGAKPVRGLNTVTLDASGVISTGLPGSYRAIDLRDTDEDDEPDLVAVTSPAMGAPNLAIFHSNPDQHLFAAAPASVTLPPAFATPEFDVRLFDAGDALPAVLGWQARKPDQQLSGRVVIARWNKQAYETVWDNNFDVFLARPTDVDGDGREEVVLFGDRAADPTHKVTEVYVLYFNAKTSAPYWIGATSLDENAHVLALADIYDGASGTSVLSLVDFGTNPGVWRGNGDGTFHKPKEKLDAATLDSLLMLGKMDMQPPDDAWIATTDLNGDRVRDVVFQGRRGVVILLGSVVKR